MTASARLDLDRAANQLYADARPELLLNRLLACSSELVGAMAGSISLLSGDGSRYVKMAERGASCRLGQTFPVDEGATGQVVARRRPVVLHSYHQIPRGHLDSGQAATAGAVAAIPMWWRGDLVGANVLFAGVARRFTAAEIDDLERLTQLAAPGLAEQAAGARLGVRPGSAEPHVAVVHRVAGVRLPVAPAHAGPHAGPTAGSPFTAREQEVLQLLAEGAGDKMIARQLCISQRTVEKHVGAVLRKTGARSRTAAVVRALDHRWLVHRQDRFGD